MANFQNQVLSSSGLVYITLYYITLYYIALYYITLYYITLYYITLYYINRLVDGWNMLEQL